MNKLFYFTRINTKIKVPRLIAVCTYCNESLPDTYKGVVDRFKGITIDLAEEKCDQKKFTKRLEESLTKWETNNNRCIWFKVNIKDAFCVPILAQKGFTFHHARDDFVMMYKWLPKDCEPNLPPSVHTNLGVGGIVFNDRNQILAISEAHYEYPHWKLPGGHVDRGEDIIAAAIREIKEETGVLSSFESLVTIRHNHNMMFGNSDIYVILMMKALSDKIIASQREVKSCQWMEIEEYLNHPHVHKFNRFVVDKALEYKRLNIKIDIEKQVVQWAQYVRDMNFLVVKSYDSDTKK